MTNKTEVAEMQQSIPAQQNRPFALTPQNIEEAIRFAEILSKASIVPKDFQNNPGNILVAVQWGMELGLQPMQAMQSIAVINGRPALWGDTVIALVRSSSVCEYIYEADDGHTATCRVKRRGEEEQVRSFSIDDAKLAGLHGKAGPWTSYPKRMRQVRARAFALRDVFPDVLRGMPVAEELQDYPEGISVIPKTEQPARPALEYYPAEKFQQSFAKWEPLIASGQKSAADVIAFAESKAMLTDEQKAQINNIKLSITNEAGK